MGAFFICKYMVEGYRNTTVVLTPGMGEGPLYIPASRELGPDGARPVGLKLNETHSPPIICIAASQKPITDITSQMTNKTPKIDTTWQMKDGNEI